ncbi:hypothetical protein ACFWY5_52725 [Nonomuraea sp. NPDC059007]|uniref:hypothetical protein n=1 Tax=Nonomuraea sp. NPDC059007 TaxID=3346692 RepID=UPI0036B10AAA
MSVEMRKQMLIAECMRQEGFTYVPFEARLADTSAVSRRELAARRGFGAFAHLAVPDDPVANHWLAYDKDPNIKLRQALSLTQRRAWAQAFGRCFVVAVKRLTGKTVKDFVDYQTSYGKEVQAAVSRELDTDPYLLRLAKAYSTCLSARGVRHASSKPTEITAAVSRPFHDELHAISGKTKNGLPVVPNMSPEAAKPYFEREVRAALIDADCGQTFRNAYFPRRAQLSAPYAKAWAMPVRG